MKSERLLKILLCIFILITSVIFCSINVFAVDDVTGEEGNEAVETYPETEAPIETEPYDEPETEAPTEPETYVEPETEAEYIPEETESITESEPEYTEAEPTEAEKTEAETQNNVWYGGVEDTTVNPTQLSTSMVSTKTYETNYTAGIVSWVCVIVGVIVIVTVLISTKHSGKSLRSDEVHYSVRR